jgi:hypothetical protein
MNPTNRRNYVHYSITDGENLVVRRLRIAELQESRPLSARHDPARRSRADATSSAAATLDRRLPRPYGEAPQVPPDVFGKLLHGAVAPFRLLAQGFHHDVVDVALQGAPKPGRLGAAKLGQAFRRIPATAEAHGGGRFFAAPRRTPPGESPPDAGRRTRARVGR